MKFVKYFLQKRSVTILLLLLVLGGGLLSYVKMGKLEDAPFTIKQALVLTPYPGASPSEVQSQVTDVLEESIQSLGELYYLKTENRAGLSKITVYVKKEIRADEMQQLWDKLRRKVNDVQSKLPADAGPSVVNDDFGDVLGVFYGLTGEGYSYRELEDQAKLIKNELLKVKDVAKVEIYGVQPPTIDVILTPSVMARSGITPSDISRAFEAQNRVVDAGGIDAGVNRIRIESTGNFYSLDDIRNLTIVSRTGEHFRLADIAEIKESYQTPPSNKMRINGSPAVGIAISTVPTGNVVNMAEAVKGKIEQFSETMPEGFELQTIYDQGYESAVANQGFIWNLIISVVTVVAILLFFIGFKNGILIGSGLVFSIFATLIVMLAQGIALQRMSLAAIIIAMGMLVVSAFLCFLLLATLCKPTTCKILFRETNPGRDKNGTKPQENKIKNASSPTSLVVDFSFLCKGTILSRELQTKSCKYAAYQTFILHGHFREDTASASCTDLCCLFQRPVKIRFMPFVHYGISADAHCIGQMYNQSAIIRNAECVFYQ